MTTIRVIDLETASFEPPQSSGSGICEVGWTDVEVIDGVATVGIPDSVLCNPGCPISFSAMGVHHITEAMVKDEPPAGEVLDKLLTPWIGGAFCAHNKKFELKFIALTLPVICTYRCAQHLWPTAPSFGNQALRYWRGLDVYSGDAHRAAFDSMVTANLLAAMISDGADVDELIALSDKPVLQQKISFGKHAGKLWEEVEVDYLEWMERKLRQEPDAWDEDVAHTARHWLQAARDPQREMFT